MNSQAAVRSRYPHLVVAEGAGVRIRRKHRDDFAGDYAWRRDPETARFDGAPPLKMGFDEFAAQAERELHFESPGRASFSIETGSGRHIGNIMYYNAGLYPDAVEIGISIGVAEWRGRGAGSAAVVAFLRFLWATTPSRLVYLHSLAWNERAQRCFARSGFAVGETVLRNGEPHVRMEARREWWLLWDSEGRFSTMTAQGDEHEGIATA